MNKLLLILSALMQRGFMFFSNPLDLDAMRAKMVEIHEGMQAIVNAAKAEDRDLNDDELDKLEALEVEFKATQRRIDRIESLAQQGQDLLGGQGRQTAPTPAGGDGGVAPAQPAARIQVDAWATPGNMGFRNLGDFAQAVHGSRNQVDPRLIQNAPTTYGQEGVGADGGYAVPPDFRTEIKEKVFGENELISRTDNLTTSGNTLTLPKDETTPWQTSGGLQAYWESEANQFTQSKPALESVSYKTNKLTSLVPITEELLEDAPALDGYLRRKVPIKFGAKINTALIAGTGAGMPLGILNSSALVSVAKESGQAADTIVYTNIVKMFARMYAPSVPSAVWLCNQDILPQLMTMEFPSSQNGTFPAWMPPGMLADAPNGSLMGRPLVPVQACPTLGDKGDLIFADMNQYLSVLKSGGVRADVSMHLYFDYDMLAYRFVMRLTGQPWWGSAITPENSSDTLGCFVTLDARA